MSNTCDVAIIGGGIIGMSCASELARQAPDARIVLFDKANPASGTTGGSAGVICLHDMGAVYAQLTLLGFARIQQLRREHGLKYHPWGALWVVYEPHALEALMGEYERRFDPHNDPDGIYHKQLLSRDELVRRYPWIKPDRVVGGILRPNQGFLDPYELVALYERLAVGTGPVTVMRNTPVLQIRKDGDRIATLVTRRGPWQARHVVNAGGPWGAKVAALAGVDLPLVPNRIQVCVATGFDDGLDRYQPTLTNIPESIDGDGVWCRGEIGGTLLFGVHHHTTQDKLIVDADHVNRVNDERYPGAVQQAFAKYYRLPKSQFLNGWCCVYGTTSDGFPILGPDPQVPNLFHAVGLNGHGMTCHAGVAMAVAEGVLRGGTRVDLEPSTGLRERMDVAPLNASRFARGERLEFKLA